MLRCRYSVLKVAFAAVACLMTATAAGQVTDNTDVITDNVENITEGYYYIVTAGNGTGYYTGDTPPDINYNYENKCAMYNQDDLVAWKTFDPTSFDQIYHFTPDGKGNWFVQSSLYGTFIDKGLSSYGARVSTSTEANTPQTFTRLSNGKYAIRPASNPYVYSMRANHNGSSSESGHLYIWGTPEEAEKYGVNVWYVYRVPEEVMDSFMMSDAGFTALITRYTNMANALSVSDAPGYYNKERVEMLKDVISQANALLDRQSTQTQRDSMSARLERAYANALVVNEIADGYYVILNNNDAYTRLYGNRPAIYTAALAASQDGETQCRYDTYSASNAHYIYYISATDAADHYSVQNAYTGLFLNTLSSVSGAGAALTCSPTLVNPQIIRWKDVGVYWISDEADREKGHSVAATEQEDKNGLITGGASYDDTPSSAYAQGNTWTLTPLAHTDAITLIREQRERDSLATIAYDEMVSYHDSIGNDYELIVNDDGNHYNASAVITLKDRENTVLSLINQHPTDILSTASDYALATANLRQAMHTALTTEPDTTQLQLLSGTPIGAVSVDYSTSSASTTVNTPADVFDGDYTTFYASYERSTGWVGLDLGTQYVIHKVAYAPRANFSNRLVLGVFEGANKADFSDAIPFHVIKDAPEYNTLTADDVECSRGFRYVRYVGPNDARTNISELRFYGTPGAGDDSHLFQLTNLPLVVIRTTAEVAEVTSRSTYLPGHINIISQDGSAIKTDSMKVRGRGNGSWTFEKKPYKFKLENKSRLLDMPAKAKEWVLINNYGDKSLVRNNVAFLISKIFEMDFTPAIRLVDVIFNGQYKGSYQLCDQVEVRKNRVDITKMDTDDNAGDSLTGGYFIEIDAYAGSEPKHFSSSPYSMPVTVHYPKSDKITDEQYAYIQATFNDLCQRVYSRNYKDSLQGYAAVLDERTWLKYFLIEELTGNTDGYYSVFMTKDRGDKFRVSPVWDFDLAFDNDKRTHPILTMDEYLSLSSRSSSATGAKSFARKIINSCTNELKELWSWYRYRGNLNYETLKAAIDSLGEVNSQSADYNYTRWDILNTPTQQQYTTRGSYKAEVDFIGDYLYDRLAWMDNKVGLEEPIGVHSTSDAQIRGGIHGHKGYVQIRGFAEGSMVEVYSISGVRVGDRITIREFDNKVALPQGVYVVRVTDSNGGTMTQKVAVE